MRSPLISIIIPTYKRIDLLERCVYSALHQSEERIEVIVVDNGSDKDIRGALRNLPDRRLRVTRLDTNVFFCGAANRGISLSNAPFVATVNDDAWLDVNWAENVLGTFTQHPHAGSVASLVLSEQDPTLIDSAGNQLDLWGTGANYLWGEPIERAPTSPTRIFGPSSAVAAYRRSALDRVGTMDEDFLAYYEDVDLSFRMHLAGYTSIFNPTCVGYHRGGATHGDRHRRAVLIERNRIWTLLKNFPGSIIRKHKRRILSSLSRPTPLHDGSSLSAFIAGRASACAGLGRVLRKRLYVQSLMVIEEKTVEALLEVSAIPSCRL